MTNGESVDVRIERVDWFDPRAVALRAAMDAESGAVYIRQMAVLSHETRDAISLAFAVDGDSISATIIVLANGEPVGHGALRPFEDAFELKKIFVAPENRGRGMSRLIMTELESIAASLGAQRVILQTGDRQLAAIALYEATGYRVIPAFGDYAVVPFEVCYEKRLA